MSESLKKRTESLKEYYEKLSKNQKIVRISLAVLFVLILTISIFTLTKTEYVVLGSGLPLDQSSRITQKLTETGIEWKTKNAATTVLVPKNKIDKARMELAVAGVDSPKVFTYDELISKQSLTMDQQTKNQLILKMKEGSIERSLMCLEPVDRAVVNLYVKKSSTFLNLEDDVSKASIVVTTAGGKKLTKEQVNGMVGIILNSVKGLKEENITIVDQNSNRLNKKTSEDNDNYEVDEQDGIKVGIEKRLNKAIEGFLVNIYGEGNVKVRTSVKLDFNGKVSEVLKFMPPIEGSTTGLVRSSNELKEKVNNSVKGGSAGTDANTTETPQYPTGEIGQKDYEKAQSILNYDFNKTVEKLEKAKGQITDISVAVIVNKKTLVDETLTEDDRLKLIELVRAAAGFDETRNVQVLAKNFFEEPVVQFEPDTKLIFGLPVWMVITIVAILLGLIIVFIVISKRKQRETEEVVQEIIEEQKELEEIAMFDDDKSSPKYQIEKFIDTRPEIVAQLLKSWMEDE